MENVRMRHSVSAYVNVNDGGTTLHPKLQVLPVWLIAFSCLNRTHLITFLQEMIVPVLRIRCPEKSVQLRYEARMMAGLRGLAR